MWIARKCGSSPKSLDFFGKGMTNDCIYPFGSSFVSQIFWRIEVRTVVVASPPFVTFVVLGSKPYDLLTEGEFLAPSFRIGDSLFILISMWASYSPGESPKFTKRRFGSPVTRQCQPLSSWRCHDNLREEPEEWPSCFCRKLQDRLRSRDSFSARVSDS